MALLARTTVVSEEARAFLQRRIGLFGLVASGCFGFFLVYRLATLESLEGLRHPSVLYHFASVLVFLGVWLVCRTGTRSARMLRVIDAVALLLGSGLFVVMGAYIPHQGRPDQVLLLALSAALTSRAIWVPSSARRTFLISLAVGVEVIVGVYFIYQSFEPARWKSVDPGVMSMTPNQISAMLALNTAAWWAITTAITTGASRVIYGLRREVQDAKQLGQYRLEEKIGDGGMGAVYRARHALLRRPTAVKLLHPERTSAEELRRFESEVQHTARLSHPNIITIYDYGHTAEGLFYYVMELLDGPTLERLVEADGAQPVGRVLRMLRQVGAALVHAHGEGLIHRDIKPANIVSFLPHRYGGQPEQLKLLDFGLVKEVKESGGIEVTQAGSISGTPQYMSPEAILEPDTVDGRSDIYSLSAVAFYLLTGRHMFDGKSTMEVLGHHMHTRAPRVSEIAPDAIPATLDALLIRCVSKDPSDRPESALAFLDELEQVPDESPWTPAAALRWWRENGARFTPVAKTTDAPDALLTVDVEAAALRESTRRNPRTAPPAAP